jgi:hypothetical protein
MKELHPSHIMLIRIGVRLKSGMDCLEAVRDIGKQAVEEAFVDAPKTDGDPHQIAGRIMAVLSVVERMEQDERDMEKALELTAAGWTAIDHRPNHLPPPANVWQKTPVFSWYWRRPGKAGKLGRLFRSTNQAWNQLQRERAK